MACPLRLEFPGALYHVTARGNARHPISNATVAFLEWGGKLVSGAPWITKHDVECLNQRALVFLRQPT